MIIEIIDYQNTLNNQIKTALECWRKYFIIYFKDKEKLPKKGEYSRIKLNDLIEKKQNNTDFLIACTKASSDVFSGFKIDYQNNFASISSYHWYRIKDNNDLIVTNFWLTVLLSIIFSYIIKTKCSNNNCLLNIDSILKNESFSKYYICNNCENIIASKSNLLLEEIKEFCNWAHLNTSKYKNDSYKYFSLPLTDIISTETKINFNNFSFIFILHLLQDLLPFIKIFKNSGIRAKNTTIIGKPYPYYGKIDTVSELRKMGFNVLLAREKEADYNGETVSSKIISSAINQRSKDKNKGIIIVEDGGYCANELINNKSLKTKIIGIVEQTTKGQRISEEAANKKLLKYPVYSIAKTRFKNNHEAPLIGRTIAENIRRILNNEHFDGRESLVIGYGSIGENVVYYLDKYLKTNVSIVENNLEKMKNINNKYPCYKTLKKALKKCNPLIIIGTTGKQSIKYSEIKTLPNKTFLVSSSSDRVEFPMNELELKTPAKRISLIYPGIEKFIIKNGKTNKEIYILAEGYPINFYASSSVPNKSIDPILCLLYLSTVYLIKDKPKAGLEIKRIDEIAIKHKLKEKFDFLYNIKERKNI